MVKLIIRYKLIKSAVFAVLAVLVLGFSRQAQVIAEQVCAGWSKWLSQKLAMPRYIVFVGVALMLDSLLSLVEGLTLQRGVWWAPWLVVGATSLLLPWEVFELVRKISMVRIALVALNLAIVAYLVRNRLKPKVVLEV